MRWKNGLQRGRKDPVVEEGVCFILYYSTMNHFGFCLYIGYRKSEVDSV